MNYVTNYVLLASPPDGKYLVGPCLNLRVKGATRSWVLRFTAPNGDRREMGLGKYLAATPAEAQAACIRARALAESMRMRIAQGIDPIEERESRRRTAKVARIEARNLTVVRMLRLWASKTDAEKSWSTRYARNVAYAIENHPPEWLRGLPISQLTASHVLRALDEARSAGLGATQVDHLRQRLSWCLEQQIKSGVVCANAAGLVRIEKGRV